MLSRADIRVYLICTYQRTCKHFPVAVVILWQFDLQLPVQLVPITTSESSSWRGVLDTTLCDKVCQSPATGRWFSPGTPVSSTNKTDCYDITEILLKVVLSTITVVIVWQFDLQLTVQSAPIITKIMSSNPAHGQIYSIQHYVMKFVSDLRHVGGILWFPPLIKLNPPLPNI